MDLVLENFSSKLEFTQIDLSVKNPLLIISLLLSVLVTIFGPPLLFAVIWFERFGSDKKRTLLNMLVNMNCWTGIAFIILGQIPVIIIYTFGPLPVMFCLLHTTVRLSIICSILMIFNAIIIFRFIYIFKLKNPAAFRDNFWCLFVSLWIYIISFIFIATLNTLANHQIMPNFICTGQITGISLKTTGKGIILLTFASAILHSAIHLKIYLHKQKFRIGTESEQMSPEAMLLKEIEKHSLSTFAIDVSGICFFVTEVVCQYMLSTAKAENLKLFPNYVYLYYADLISPCFGIIFGVIFLFKKETLRRNLIENVKRLSNKFAF